MSSFVFMGTPEFSTVILDALEQAGLIPDLIVTQPDRPCGRGRVLTPSPVAQWAHARKIVTLKPQNSKEPAFYESLSQLSPDLIVTAAFGQLLPQSVLSIPKKGCLNLHASLLPRYRGASPIQAALLAGDRVTGVTVMQMDEGLDTGPILARSPFHIPEDMNAGELHQALAELSGRLMVATMPTILKGKLQAHRQDESQASVTRLLVKSDGEVDFSQDAPYVHNHIRAMNPWPGAFAFLDGKRYKINRTRLYDATQALGEPGELHILDRRMIVSCAKGAVELIEIQPQSGSSMRCEVCSHNFEEGSVFDACSRADLILCRECSG